MCSALGNIYQHNLLAMYRKETPHITLSTGIVKVNNRHQYMFGSRLIGHREAAIRAAHTMVLYIGTIEDEKKNYVLRLKADSFSFLIGENIFISNNY